MPGISIISCSRSLQIYFASPEGQLSIHCSPTLIVWTLWCYFHGKLQSSVGINPCRAIEGSLWIWNWKLICYNFLKPVLLDRLHFCLLIIDVSSEISNVKNQPSPGNKKKNQCCFLFFERKKKRKKMFCGENSNPGVRQMHVQSFQYLIGTY